MEEPFQTHVRGIEEMVWIPMDMLVKSGEHIDLATRFQDPKDLVGGQPGRMEVLETANEKT